VFEKQKSKSEEFPSEQLLFLKRPIKAKKAPRKVD